MLVHDHAADRLAPGHQVDSEDAARGRLRLQPGIGALESLGRTDLEVEWTDESELSGPSFLYARLVLADGEMAWTSPIWVDPA